MKFLVHFVCTNCTQTKMCEGMHQLEAGDWKDAAKDTIDAVAAACGISDQKIDVKMIERCTDNPLQPFE